jgi:hypothetical protein
MLRLVGLEVGTNVSDELFTSVFFYTENITPKRWYQSTKLHVVTPQETVSVVTALRISNPTVCMLLSVVSIL